MQQKQHLPQAASGSRPSRRAVCCRMLLRSVPSACRHLALTSAHQTGSSRLPPTAHRFRHYFRRGACLVCCLRMITLTVLWSGTLRVQKLSSCRSRRW